MRKITQQAVDAFMTGYSFKSGNTKVISYGDLISLYLHGNLIAIKSAATGIIISTDGWATNTTKERLNGIPGVNIQQKSRKWFLNGKEWNGEWIEI